MDSRTIGRMAVVLAVAIGLGWPMAASAVVIDNTTKFTTSGSGRDIVLGSSSTWSASFTDNNTFFSQLHGLLGAQNTAGLTDVSWSDGSRLGLTAPNVLLGTTSFWFSGYAVYKFVVASGYALTGGTVTAHFAFNGIPDGASGRGYSAKIGISTDYAPATPSLNNPAYPPTTFAVQDNVSRYFAGQTVSTVYTGNFTLNIPANLSTFYVIIGDFGAGGFTFGYNSLTVNATLVTAPPTPVITPNGGTALTPKQSVTITDSDGSAVIHYTTNGTPATASSPVYSGPFYLASDTTVNAVAVNAGLSSSMASATFTFTQVNNFVTTDSSKDIVLTQANPNFSTNLGSWDNLTGNLWGILGASNASLQSQMKYTPGTYGSLGPGVLEMDTFSAWFTGFTVYKFVTPAGMYTNGGTVSCHAGYIGNWSQGASPNGPALSIAPSVTYPSNLTYVTGTFSPTTDMSTDTDHGYGAYYKTMTLTIPAGLNTFYVVLAKGTYSILFAYDNLTVNAALTAAPDAPVITPPGGTFTPKQQVTITDSDNTATIYYTLDGSDPTTSSLVYTSPFYLASDTTVKAKSWVGGIPSGTATATFSFPQVNSFVTTDSSKDIVLTQANPSFATDLSSWDNFVGNVWGILGGCNTNLQTQLKYVQGAADGMGPGVIQINTLYVWFTGDVVYKFVTAPGTVTTGGTVACHAMYRGNWNQGTGSTLGIGTSVTYPTNLSLISNYGSFTTTDMSVETDIGYGSYYKTMTLDIPAGLNTFYVAVCKGGYSVQFDFDNLTVNATLQVVPNTPVISPAGGAFYQSPSVTITSNAPIHYTTDGTEPTESSTPYTGAFTVATAQTIKAKAFNAGVGSVTASATFSFPTSFNRPTMIPQGSGITVNGDLSEWSSAQWAPLDQVYSGNPTDIAEGYYAAKWDPASGKVYVAAKVRDTDHKFTDTFTAWNVHDALEIYVHTNGAGTPAYQGNQIDAQQYVVGLTTDGVSVWSVLGDGLAIPAQANFQAAATASGQWLYYEAVISPFQVFSLSGSGMVACPLAVGQVIGLDCVATSANASGTYTGQKAENLLTGKYNDYTQFGLHKLVASVVYSASDLATILAAMDSTPSDGNWNAQADIDNDGEVTSSDLAIVLANLQ